MPKAEKSKKKGGKLYAVKVGRVPGIYETWEEAEAQVCSPDEGTICINNIGPLVSWSYPQIIQDGGGRKGEHALYPRDRPSRKLGLSQ